MRFSIHSIVLTVLMMTVPSGAAAQPAPGSGRNPDGRGGGGSGRLDGTGTDPLRFRHLTISAIREKLAASDDQWKSLWPRIEKVLEAQRNARTGAAISVSSGSMVKGNAPANVRGPTKSLRDAAAAPHAETPAARAMQEVRAALDGAETSDAALLEKVAAMRAARDAARAELAAAQDELRSACSVRQEAVLVTLGLLE